MSAHAHSGLTAGAVETAFSSVPQVPTEQEFADAQVRLDEGIGTDESLAADREVADRYDRLMLQPAQDAYERALDTQEPFARWDDDELSMGPCPNSPRCRHDGGAHDWEPGIGGICRWPDCDCGHRRAARLVRP